MNGIGKQKQLLKLQTNSYINISRADVHMFTHFISLINSWHIYVKCMYYICHIYWNDISCYDWHSAALLPCWIYFRKHNILKAMFQMHFLGTKWHSSRGLKWQMVNINLSDDNNVSLQSMTTLFTYAYIRFQRVIHWGDNSHSRFAIIGFLCEDAVECRYNAVQCNKILHEWLQELRQNINKRLDPKKTPHTSP